jgi:Zinc knuckle
MTYGGQGQPMIVDRKCFKCGRRGHFAKECRSGGQIREMIDEDAQEVQSTFKYFNCNEEGHMARNCRKPKKGQQQHIDIERENKDLRESLAKMKDTMDILTARVEDLKEEEL